MWAAKRCLIPCLITPYCCTLTTFKATGGGVHNSFQYTLICFHIGPLRWLRITPITSGLRKLPPPGPLKAQPLPVGWWFVMFNHDKNITMMLNSMMGTRHSNLLWLLQNMAHFTADLTYPLRDIQLELNRRKKQDPLLFYQHIQKVITNSVRYSTLIESHTCWILYYWLKEGCAALPIWFILQ